MRRGGGIATRTDAPHKPRESDQSHECREAHASQQPRLRTLGFKSPCRTPEGSLRPALQGHSGIHVA